MLIHVSEFYRLVLSRARRLLRGLVLAVHRQGFRSRGGEHRKHVYLSDPRPWPHNGAGTSPLSTVRSFGKNPHGAPKTRASSFACAAASNFTALNPCLHPSVVGALPAAQAHGSELVFLYFLRNVYFSVLLYW